MSHAVRQATIHDVDTVASLFDAYRQFYGQPADLARARDFLLARFRHHESVVLLATDGAGKGAGFVQLYPLFSSVSTARIYLLNDLFVAPHARRAGVGELLMRESAVYARAAGAIRLELTTAYDNLAAQALYESLGWQLGTEFRSYSYAL